MDLKSSPLPDSLAALRSLGAIDRSGVRALVADEATGLHACVAQTCQMRAPGRFVACGGAPSAAPLRLLISRTLEMLACFS